MEASSRHRLFEAGRRRAHLSVERLWLDYLALGGEASPAELEGYLHGLMPLSRYQQDVLAHTLNEHLADLDHAHHLPYWLTPPP